MCCRRAYWMPLCDDVKGLPNCRIHFSAFARQDLALSSGTYAFRPRQRQRWSVLSNGRYLSEPLLRGDQSHPSLSGDADSIFFAPACDVIHTHIWFVSLRLP
uniref:Integron gene cassette protein n=1 Tax=Steinernema glaseri TaxID=37863 RepID=A0A1I8A0V7_9BILA